MGSRVMEQNPTLQGTYVPNMNAFWGVVAELWTFEKLAFKTLMQCEVDANTKADDRGDYNNSLSTLYRWAKIYHFFQQI